MFDAINLKAVAAIPAHDSPLAALAFSYSGNRLASASNTVSCIWVVKLQCIKQVSAIH